MQNTLAASDYGMLDPNSFTPRPNYWSALLWRRLMGTTVLDAGRSPASSLHLYAHCLLNHPGGVALLVINADRSAAQSLAIPTDAQRYTLTAQNLEEARVQLNGSELRMGQGDALPALRGEATPAGTVTFAPASITFLALHNAENANCR
jgi:hypothetical protein